MNWLFHIFPYIPFIGLLVAFLPKNKEENLIFRITVGSILVHGIGLTVAIIDLLIHGLHGVSSSGISLYTSGTSDFTIKFYLDIYSAVYSLMSATITLLVCVFSKYYIHRERGFKRFFNNLLFFYGGLQMILLSGNFETLFIGWEILGVTSFFLICFYRDRYLPVKNSFKVFSIYRLADIFLLLGIWLSHHVHHQSISFADLYSTDWLHHHLDPHTTYLSHIIPFVFLVAAVIKSAQFPFSYWLPRAMEGPTSSSAVFYGSLSVHIGVFLLIRMAPMWEHHLTFRIMVVSIGIITSLVATSIARVQSTVKTQIAYASITQIGIMFIEVALGFYIIALIHFVANAFLRCYQLLVSPSVLSYKIHDQFFNFEKPEHHFPDSFWGRLKSTVFILGIKEWNLDAFMYTIAWKPLKKAGELCSTFVTKKSISYFFLPLYAVLLFLVYNKQLIPPLVVKWMPEALSVISITLILKAFVDRDAAYWSWSLVLLNQLYMAMSIAFNEQFDFNQIHIYLSGILICGLLGYLCIRSLESKGEKITLNDYHGLSWIYPNIAFLFVIACLGLAGFPNTPTFIGEDLLLGHIHENQVPLTVITALNLILDCLVAFRIYARLFLGPHERGEVAFKSS